MLVSTALLSMAYAGSWAVVDDNSRPVESATVFIYDCLDSGTCTSFVRVEVDSNGTFKTQGADALRIEAPGYWPLVMGASESWPAIITLENVPSNPRFDMELMSRIPACVESTCVSGSSRCATSKRRIRRLLGPALQALDWSACFGPRSTSPFCPRLSGQTLWARFEVSSHGVSNLIWEPASVTPEEFICLGTMISSVPLPRRGSGVVDLKICR